MPVPAFGFSAGDFIAAISIVHKSITALKDAGGGTNEYQALLQELEHLQLVLDELANISSASSSSQNHYNAVIGMAYEVQIPLKAFADKMHASFGHMLDSGFGRRWISAKEKINWAISMQKEVQNIRAIVTMKLVSICVLLAMSTG